MTISLDFWSVKHSGLAFVARDAVDLLSSAWSERIRICENPLCAGRFADLSRPGRRRWCAMNTCGNLAKKQALRCAAGPPTVQSEATPVDVRNVARPDMRISKKSVPLIPAVRDRPSIFGVVPLGWLVKNEGESPLKKQQDYLEAVSPHNTHIMKRTASAVWRGDLKKGQGSLSTQSGVLNKTQYSFATRFENGIGTNPEELIAAAHAGCFTMALSAFLGNAGFTPEELSTQATLTLEQVEGNWTITAIHLDLSGRVPGIDAAKFDEIADQAKAGCPVSRVFKADITLTKKLET
jgi:lipoyl-dependent peroxiredoxin